MQHPIAQAAALTIFGNDILRGRARPDFWPGSTAFVYCKHVRFVTLHGDVAAPSESAFAEDPVQWIAALQAGGVRGLRLHHFTVDRPLISDRMSAGFAGGGGRGIIEALYRDVSDQWQGKWVLGDRKDPERKIWEITYGRIIADSPHLAWQETNLGALQRDLAETLVEIEAFARRRTLEPFADAFREALGLLAVEAPLAKTFHHDLAPELPHDAQQILAAAQSAWVFGGMGSWNDLGFEGDDRQEYERVSDRLFSLLNAAISAAVNASYAGDADAADA
ncbi:MAG TPA: hypothetical protein VMT54_13415 [Candidatus Cybelea sp.]|nr:hypothetical protein [Candidatus Cybelea sp.]